MAPPATLRGTQLYIKVGDAASPEVFSHPCLINAARGFEMRAGTNDIVVPDCSNPDDPAWRELVKDVLSGGLTGEGVMDNTLENLQFYTSWWKSSTPKNVQVWVGTIGYWSGAFNLTQWALTGDRSDKIRVSLTLESDGEISDFTQAP